MIFFVKIYEKKAQIADNKAMKLYKVYQNNQKKLKKLVEEKENLQKKIEEISSQLNIAKVKRILFF